MGRPATIDWEQVNRLIKSGMALREIAVQVGCSPHSLKHRPWRSYEKKQMFDEKVKCPVCEHEWTEQVPYRPIIKRREYCEGCRSNIEMYNITSFEEIKEGSCRVVGRY